MLKFVKLNYRDSIPEVSNFHIEENYRVNTKREGKNNSERRNYADVELATREWTLLTV